MMMMMMMVVMMMMMIMMMIDDDDEEEEEEEADIYPVLLILFCTRTCVQFYSDVLMIIIHVLRQFAAL